MKVFKDFKKNILRYLDSETSDSFIILDSCNYKKDKYSSFDYLIAFGEKKNENRSLKDFYLFNQRHKDEWKFGYFSYDLKNEIFENFDSKNEDFLQFPPIYFFTAKNIFFIKKNKLIVEKTEIKDLDTFVEKINNYKYYNDTTSQIDIKNRISKNDYLDKLEKIKLHIKRGNIYEVNFCQEFCSENSIVDPVDIFIKLKKNSQAPFSSFMKIQNKYIISSSPERFLKKIDDRLISQPIKGTSKRGSFFLQDLYLKWKLKNSQKEISENTMIVDLVRNDLGIICEKGDVKVDEYCKVYSFKSVHQLISTISCKLKKNISFKNILEATFPMGSMTGAPKHMSMQIIEEFEQTKRGVYSGALGYISPDQNFDFNVSIRTGLYNKENKYLSFITGGAITDKSIPKDEYQECRIKSKAIVKSL